MNLLIVQTPERISIGMRQAQYRVQAPNSRPREILIIPLGVSSAQHIAQMTGHEFKNAQCLGYSSFGQTWRDVLENKNVDLVIMVAEVGEGFGQAIAIGETCVSRQIKTSSILLHMEKANSQGLSNALRSLRLWTRTLAVISDADYLPGLLHALGA